MKSSQCSFSSSLLQWGAWWERFLQERIFVRWQATSFTFMMIYLSRTIWGKWKFIWTNSKLQSQLRTMLAICERGDTQPGGIGPVKCLEWPKRSHFTSPCYFFYNFKQCHLFYSLASICQFLQILELNLQRHLWYWQQPILTQLNGLFGLGDLGRVW